MIRVESLTKAYGSVTVLDDVSFEARPGQVTGFLGPNGAGKTTTLRVLVGLTAPTSGRATVAGSPYRDLPNPGRHVGVLLDATAQHQGRTGRETLVLGARTMGLAPQRVEEVLARVSLSDVEAGRRVRHYSLGMLQRLGLAHALLGEPAVLVLDEPANGLDPAGIRWLRELLADHAARGGTVLLSSHLLHEVEAVADEVVVIGRGRVVARGEPRTLQAASGRDRTLVSSLDDPRLAGALREAGLEVSAQPGPLAVAAGAADVGRVALAAGVVLTELRASSTGLEDLFLELTADVQREAVHPAGQELGA